MHAFIGTVPFTLIEAINYVISYEIKDADLYFVTVFDGASEMGERIRKANIFRNVYMVEDVLLTYPITLKKCLKVVKNGEKLQKDLRGRRYDYIYYNNSGWLINSIFYNGIYKGNSNVKNIFLEHGYSTYIKHYEKKPWYLRILINLVGLKCMDGSMLDEVYMFEPELNCVKQNGTIRKMKKIDKNNESLRKAMNYIWSYNVDADSEYKNKKVIIMEQGPQKVEFDKEKFWEEILSVLDLEQVIVKAHPRQKNSTLSNFGVKISRNHVLPWEIEVLNHDMNNKVLMTIFSGACLSSKLLFEEEPTIIFLYKLLPVDYSFLGEELVDFANKVGDLYENKTKYFIPESLEELQEYCNRIGIGRK